MNKHVLDWIFLYIISVAVLTVGQFMFHSGLNTYYRYAPISTFYELEYYIVDDVCVGDTVQNAKSNRMVYKTDTGYAGEITREMFLYKDGLVIKVVEERAMPFIEVRLDGLATRQQKLPDDLETGTYQWIMYLTLNIHGVQRDDIPPIESNFFEVTNCDDK